MARRRRHPEPASTELNLTSMIDVVFQLLIYFIVGTSFAMGEQSYRRAPRRSIPSNSTTIP